MRKLMIGLAALVTFVGCSAMDGTYGKAKGVYKAGKKVYEIQPIKSNAIEAVGGTAEAYDGLREKVRGK